MSAGERGGGIEEGEDGFRRGGVVELVYSSNYRLLADETRDQMCVTREKKIIIKQEAWYKVYRHTRSAA